ncbi:MAG: GNAT family N-acetyltransferase [Capsulimonadales bacterium]|nr:GNAT family N-acetyltransferase [Capsulimonadales bacterium]
MLTIRPARFDDADVFLALIDALADYEKLARPDDAARARLIEDGFRRTPPRFHAYLILKHDTAIGYAITLETYSSFLAKPTLYIEDLFLLPDARGRGVGSAVLRYLANIALERGCGRMEWVCLDWNRTAIDFYERHGAEHLTEWRYYRLTEERLNRLVAPEQPVRDERTKNE